MAITATAASPPQPTSLRVLTDSALLAHIARFQRGLPLPFEQLRAAYDASLPATLPAVAKGQFPSLLWLGVLRDGPLRFVKTLYRWRALPEAKENRLLAFDGDVPTWAAKFGRLDVLQWLDGLATKEPRWHGTLLDTAIAAGTWSVAQWLLDNRLDACADKIYSCMTRAAGAGQLGLLKQLVALHPSAVTTPPVATPANAFSFDSTVSQPPSILEVAARKGQLEVVKYLHKETEATCTTDAMDYACVWGHLDVVRFLHDHRSEGCTIQALDNAAISGNLALVRFLHEHRSEGCTTAAMDWAAYHGHHEVIRFLHEHRTEGCTTKAMDNAATKGHLEIVAFLHGHRTEGCTEEAIVQAAIQGHLKIVQFLREKRGLKLPTRALDQAIGAGHLDVVEYLYEVIHLPLDNFSMIMADKSGNMETIEYVTKHSTKEPRLREDWK